MATMLSYQLYLAFILLVGAFHFKTLSLALILSVEALHLKTLIEMCILKILIVFCFTYYSRMIAYLFCWTLRLLYFTNHVGRPSLVECFLSYLTFKLN
jgi:hypothetical protein